MTERYLSEQPGITTLHTFSAGAHYDPDNMSFGPIVGCDEHRVEPGAGFDWHAHRGVHILSWVLDGTLRHEDSHGEVRFVPPGVLLVQSTGSGVRHTETNASDVDPLRFVQITVLGDSGSGVRTLDRPTVLDDVSVEIRGDFVDHGRDSMLVFLTAGLTDEGIDRAPGDVLLLDQPILHNGIEGTGRLLLLEFDATSGNRQH